MVFQVFQLILLTQQFFSCKTLSFDLSNLLRTCPQASKPISGTSYAMLDPLVCFLRVVLCCRCSNQTCPVFHLSHENFFTALIILSFLYLMTSLRPLTHLTLEGIQRTQGSALCSLGSLCPLNFNAFALKLCRWFLLFQTCHFLLNKLPLIETLQCFNGTFTHATITFPH